MGSGWNTILFQVCYGELFLSVMYGHEWKAIKGTEKILPDYITKKGGAGRGGAGE